MFQVRLVDMNTSQPQVTLTQPGSQARPDSRLGTTCYTAGLDLIPRRLLSIKAQSQFVICEQDLSVGINHSLAHRSTVFLEPEMPILEKYFKYFIIKKASHY